MNTVTTHTVKKPTKRYGKGSYMDLMTYIHSMPVTRKVKEQVARRLTLEVTSPALSRVYDRLEELSLLKEDWDGEGALPISRKVLRNLKYVLLISNDDDWEDWTIGPDANATIGLQSKRSRACVSLGANEFSYFVRKDGMRMADSHVEFTPAIFLDTLRKIG